MSSSGHLALVPRLLGWRLLVARRQTPARPSRSRCTRDRRRRWRSPLRGGILREPHLQALTFAAAGAGRARARATDRAAAGWAALGGDRADRRRRWRSDRGRPAAGAALRADRARPPAVGIAQATALVPGVSRAGRRAHGGAAGGAVAARGRAPVAPRRAAGDGRRRRPQGRARGSRGRAGGAAGAGRGGCGSGVRLRARGAAVGARDALARGGRLPDRARGWARSGRASASSPGARTKPRLGWKCRGITDVPLLLRPCPTRYCSTPSRRPTHPGTRRWRGSSSTCARCSRWTLSRS